MMDILKFVIFRAIAICNKPPYLEIHDGNHVAPTFRLPEAVAISFLFFFNKPKDTAGALSLSSHYISSMEASVISHNSFTFPYASFFY